MANSIADEHCNSNDKSVAIDFDVFVTNLAD